jgi:hypothetical protein
MYIVIHDFNILDPDGMTRCGGGPNLDNTNGTGTAHPLLI